MFELNVIKSKLVSDRNDLLLLRTRRLFSLAAFAVLALLVSRVVLLSRAVASQQAGITKLQTAIDLSKSVNGVNEMESEWQKYAGEIDQAARMVGARSSWGDKLGILSRALPRGLCLDVLSVSVASDDESKRLLKLDTVVFSKEKPGYELANSLMEGMKKTKRFGEEIKTNSQDITEIGGKDLQSISIVAIVR
jgi:hypothetical protein